MRVSVPALARSRGRLKGRQPADPESFRLGRLQASLRGALRPGQLRLNLPAERPVAHLEPAERFGEVLSFLALLGERQHRRSRVSVRVRPRGDMGSVPGEEIAAPVHLTENAESMPAPGSGGPSPMLRTLVDPAPVSAALQSGDELAGLFGDLNRDPHCSGSRSQSVAVGQGPGAARDRRSRDRAAVPDRGGVVRELLQELLAPLRR